MTYDEAIRAGAALQQLSAVPLPYPSARLVIAWQNYCAAALQELRDDDEELCRSSGGAKADDGSVHFPTQAAADAFRAGRDRLLRGVIQRPQPLKLDLRETLPQLRISANALCALRPVTLMEDDDEVT